MNISIMQPYFLPYIGYFQLVAASDIFVSLDDVNFIKRGWINRNNLYFGGKRSLFSIPLDHASQNRNINEIQVSSQFGKWKQRFMRSLETWYGKENNFEEGSSLVQEILTFSSPFISEINLNAIRIISQRLGLTAKIHSSSRMDVPRTKGTSHLLNIALRLGANVYVNPPGGKSLYCESMFSLHGISLKFLKPVLHSYKMPEWIPGLSILDPIMRIGCAETASKLMGGWSLECGEKSFASAFQKEQEKAVI